MIKIIAVGKNNPALKEYEADLARRIKMFSRYEFVELKEDKSKNPAQIIIKEDMKILEKIKDNDLVYALDVSGVCMDSVAFSEELKKNRDIVFVIGGAYGFGNNLRKRADKLVSFSPMTFNHQIFRVMLLEQVYRGFSIINNRKYHK
ncbi:MAG: 23S rRNA (pseudouridine(1915)-N(3))-methyltransferase RlmH [Candidatus Aenigmarchaeota archaeon]|nr:23S rRNA (pseudouridine(1915)-N(3))-methyltransferase RlmH [Candidatus Aenigmarchaeota archaeon]